jgi:predicted aconitase/predicted aconitase with swiveling domain
MRNNLIILDSEQQAMFDGARGSAKQMAMRLLVDMAAAAGARELIPIESAHLSGVSPLTGGMGLRRFLARLAEDPQARVAVPTTLNSAGCDARQFAAMRIVAPGFLEQSQEIVALYTRLGVQPTQSCIPYEWEGVITDGDAAWAESNAICFGNSYCGLRTNRESGLSALASALTGYTPKYGLLNERARRPNLIVQVTCRLDEPTDFSLLGDWIGMNRPASWQMPFGPIPLIKGLPADLSHEQRKALAAAAANYGSPLLYVDGQGEAPEETEIQGSLTFGQEELRQRYEALYPRAAVSLVVIGCPQASIGELRTVARLLKRLKVSSDPDDGSGRPPLWVFTSSANLAIAEQTGLANIIRESGALLLQDTCPEVVPYDQRWVKHVLTNSMKAEHYIKSGLNGIPTSVMRLADCVAVASGQKPVEAIGAAPSATARRASTVEQALKPSSAQAGKDQSDKGFATGAFSARGQGLPSQTDFSATGRALVTGVPITLLGFVNRRTGVIEEAGHPADGQSMAGKIVVFPKGSGSTVAPYVLLELYYRGAAPIAVVNTEIDQQSAPACSLEGIPYAYGFDRDVISGINNGDLVTLSRAGDQVTIRVVQRTSRQKRD